MAQSSDSPRRVALIVDDEISLATELKANLRTLGFDVCDVATNGGQAYWLAIGDQPDVVLMDVCLEGGREGIEVARQLREACGASIIFVTAYTDGTTVERIHERVPGAPILPKPVHRDQLAHAVAEVVH